MDKIIGWPPQERAELFELTATNRGMSAAVVEKDFWVCWILGKLFRTEGLEEKIMFKGGTTLSKVFGIIERFSEDIDLVLDWKDFVPEPPDKQRSRTKQNEFNRRTNQAAQVYLRDSFLPMLKGLIGNHCKVSIDTDEPHIIKVRYPASFSETYIRPEVLLEMRPLASWEPHDSYDITPYAAEEFPERFKNSNIRVRSIKAERTFWEKATILHVEAHRPEDKVVPERYSRHYYDMMFLANSSVKQSALADLDLLNQVVEFKDKYYHQNWANYPTAVPGSFRLYPPEHVRKSLKRDYDDMQVMIFGQTPRFEEIMNAIKDLEKEINQLKI